MIENKKASILLILKVLEEYSDEDHFLTQQDIIDKVDELYGIELERKSVAFSISLLQELDYDINKSPRGGYALLSRSFDNSEIRYIVDSLFSSKSISGKQAAELSKKLNSCLSKYQRKDYNFIYKSNEINRTENKELFYTLELIEEAKRRGKRISFQYLTFDENGKPYTKMDGFRYIVSPYYSANSGGRYFLICNYREKYRAITWFRIDYMVNPKIEEEWPIKPIESLKGVKNFDIADYLNDNIYLLDGEVIKATLEIENPNYVQFVIDWFGRNARTYKKENKLYADIKCNESALFYWYMQYSECVTIVSPQSLIDRVKKEAERIVKKYE
jgi:predicted DNA-binding transcriptional regulator YafY